MKIFYAIIAFCLLSLSASAARAQAAPADEATDTSAESAKYARELGSIDPLTRQAAAEDLARLSAVEQKKIVEGYILQEKDKRVRLALNWALYRMGKSETLFQIVRELDSSRHEQAAEYLTHLDSPEPLYLFLSQGTNPPKVILRLVEVLGKIGVAETVEKLKPFTSHYDPKIADAAKTSIDQIQHRLTEPQPEIKTRPRAVTKGKEPLQNREQ